MVSVKYSFTIIDYFIFALALIVSMAIGLWAAISSMRKKNSQEKRLSNEEFLLGGRKMPIIPTTLSLFSSVVSGIALLSYPAEIYTRGSTLTWTIPGMICALIFSCIFVIPVVYHVKSVSIYQYLEDRFESKILRIIGSVSFTLSMLMYMSVVLYSPAIALAGVTDIPVWTMIVIVGLVCTTYTTIGGLKGVVWTDAFQSLVMYAGSVTLVIKGTMAVGSPAKVWEIAGNYNRLDGFTNFDPDPFQYMTAWTASFGGFFYWLGSFGSSQLAIQRYLSMPSITKARILAFLTIPCMLFVNFLVFYTGFTMFAYYANCDPLKAGKIQTRDQLVIYFMMEILQDITGLRGLFLACLLSGTLSTVSSGVNSLSAVSWEDFLKPTYIFFTKKQPGDKVATLSTRTVGIFYGLCAIGLAFSAQPLGGIFSAVTSGLGALSGPCLGLMLLGYLVPWANWIGGLSGTLLGAFLALWVFIGAVVTKPPKPNLHSSVAGCNITTYRGATSVAVALATETSTVFHRLPVESALYRFYSLSYFMFPLLGAVSAFIFGCFISALTGGSNVAVTKPDLLYWTCKPPEKKEDVPRSRSGSYRRPSIQNVDLLRYRGKGPSSVNPTYDMQPAKLSSSSAEGSQYRLSTLV